MNLVDLLQWTLNTQKGHLKRHLSFLPQYYAKQTEFYIMNSSIVQVCKAEGLERPSNKYLVHVRNSAFNFETYY